VEALETALGCKLDEVTDYNWGFDDEYTTCTSCSNVIRISPDSYSWTPDYLATDGEILCKDCITLDDVISQIENNPNEANTIYSEHEIIDAGYVKIGRQYENGWYGVRDNPKEIYDRYKKKYSSIIFSINHNEQFRTCFNAYGRN
jgi:hypothetical protein